jgi:hypothetical protein
LGVIQAMAAALAAAAFNPGCQSEPLVPGNAGAAGTQGAAGTTGHGTGFGGNIIGGGGTTGGFNDTCGAANYSTAPIPPDILILLDASGSMNDDLDNNTCNGGCGASSKWTQATTAIDAVVFETDGSVRWGLKFFADSDITCGVNNNVPVPVAPGNAGAIASAIAGRTTQNGGVANGTRTPTRAAENAGVTYLMGLTDVSPKFLLLVTDGLPNCTPGSADQAADDSAGAVAAVTFAAQAGIPTMVVGLSTAGTPADTTLSDLAIAGGYPRAGTPAYYAASSAADLTTALHALIDLTPSCIFALPPAPTSTDFRGFDVAVGGTLIPRDTTHTNGWDLTSSAETSFEIYGPICDDIKAGKATSVQVVFRCLLI